MTMDTSYPMTATFLWEGRRPPLVLWSSSHSGGSCYEYFLVLGTIRPGQLAVPVLSRTAKVRVAVLEPAGDFRRPPSGGPQTPRRPRGIRASGVSLGSAGAQAGNATQTGQRSRTRWAQR